ncbi:MAG: hypothetical protein ACI9W4_002934, partial [Rhodothermales bacterium]
AQLEASDVCDAGRQVQSNPTESVFELFGRLTQRVRALMNVRLPVLWQQESAVRREQGQRYFKEQATLANTKGRSDWGRRLVEPEVLQLESGYRAHCFQIAGIAKNGRVEGGSHGLIPFSVAIGRRGQRMY